MNITLKVSNESGFALKFRFSTFLKCFLSKLKAQIFIGYETAPSAEL